MGCTRGYWVRIGVVEEEKWVGAAVGRWNCSKSVQPEGRQRLAVTLLLRVWDQVRVSEEIMLQLTWYPCLYIGWGGKSVRSRSPLNVRTCWSLLGVETTVFLCFWGSARQNRLDRIKGTS